MKFNVSLIQKISNRRNFISIVKVSCNSLRLMFFKYSEKINFAKFEWLRINYLKLFLRDHFHFYNSNHFKRFSHLKFKVKLDYLYLFIENCL